MKKFSGQLIVFFSAFIFFLLTLAENFSGPHDSIEYLICLVRGYPLVNQHHLLYHFSAYYWLQVTQAIFPGVKDYFLVEAFTAIWGSGSLAVVYGFFVNRFRLPVSHAVAGVLLVAFTYGFWFYSTNIEVYGPPMFLLLLALYRLTATTLSAREVRIVILLHCLAILFHQINILFTPVVLFILYKRRREFELIPALLTYVLMGIVLVGGAYFYVGWVHEGQNSLGAWIRWMEGYARDESYWHPLNLNTPVNVAFGYSHAFIGGHFFFQLPFVHNELSASLAEHSLSDEMFIARNMSETTAAILGICTLVLAALMIMLLVRFLRAFSRIPVETRAIFFPLLLAGAIYSLFFCFWMPEILEFWLLQTVLVWLILVGAMPYTGFPLRLSPRVGTLLMALLLLVINYFGSIRWMQDINNDLYYQKAEVIKPELKPGDAILLQDGWILGQFLSYYTTADVLSVSKSGSDSLNQVSLRINEHLKQGGRIFIYPEMNSPGKPGDTQYIDSLKNRYADRLKVFRPENPRILVIGNGITSNQ